jgi:hypothetical protein
MSAAGAPTAPASDVTKEMPQMTSPDRRLARRALIVLAVVSAALCLAAPGAAAAPAVEVTLGNDAQGVQEVLVNATSGQFRLTYGADTTPDLSVGLSAEAMEDALDALPSIDGEGGSVSVFRSKAESSSIANAFFEYWVHFAGGPLAHQEIPPLGVALGTVPLSGLASNVSVTTLSHGDVSRSDERLEYTLDIRDTGSSPVGGGLTAKVELPAGQETSVYGFIGEGWTCTAAPAAGALPASATCTRAAADPLAAGDSYPQLRVIVALGADAPEHAVAVASVSGADFATASDSNEFDFTPARVFGISEFEARVVDSSGAEYTQAGAHPFASVSAFGFPRYKDLHISNAEGVHLVESLEFPRERFEKVERVKDIDVDLPRGFVGNALAVPQLCPGMAQVAQSTCPAGSVVGGITLENGATGTGQGALPIYAIQPEFGTPAQFAFSEPGFHTTYSFSPRLRADDGYAITLESPPVAIKPGLVSVPNVTLCSFGGNRELSNPNGVFKNGVFQGCKEADDPTANPKPLVTDPTRCVGPPPTVRLSVDSWEHPGELKSAEVINPLPTGCSKVNFQPVVDLQPTSHQADSPTGMDVEIAMPTEGLENPQGIGQANLDNVTVTFPKGMSVNPSASQGLGACTPEEVKLGSNADDECPLSSKIGTVEVDTPLIQDTLTGNVYLAAQRNNPFDSSVGLYLVFSSKKDGITIKVAGKVVPDPITGQLTTVFTENPEAPFSRLAMHLNSGPRAPLVSPPRCGTYAIHSELSPWSAADPANPAPSEIVAGDSSYEVTSGPGGGPCPTGALDAKLEAGLKNPTAGARSPFVLRLTREDGSQRFTGLDLTMPTGLSAYLKGVPYCPDNVLTGISGEELTGRPELAAPACPAASQVGTVTAGAGAGPNPFQAPGRVYLAGPYKGAPLSLAIVTPAVAGPFDLGNVVVRSGLYVDPDTAQVTVKSDPIPTIVHGFLLDLRELRVSIDRPGFTTAPTSCEPKTVDARVQGESGADESLSNRFQVGGCEGLGFKPRLKLSLKGGTRRAKYPALKAVLTQKPGEADIGSVSVALPHSEFLEQGHIKTICTRVQFNSVPRTCPARSIYGYAEAESPLLGYELSGPVYLRSSEHKLPDLVAALKGPDSQPIEIDLVGRIDSVHGGIRNSFETVPDAPVTRFVLRMQGGKKGLLVNSADLCKLKAKQRKVTVRVTGQNGKRADQSPVLANQCHQKHKHHKKQHGHHAAGKHGGSGSHPQ